MGVGSGSHGDDIPDAKTLQAHRCDCIDGQDIDLTLRGASVLALQQRQELTIDVAGSDIPDDGFIGVSITTILRYVVDVLSLLVSLDEKLLDGIVRCYGVSCPRYRPSQCVIWLGAWLLQATRYITRQ